MHCAQTRVHSVWEWNFQNTFFQFRDEDAVDLLVANAGVGRFGSIESMSEEDFDLSFNTNVKGVWLWTREQRLSCGQLY